MANDWVPESKSAGKARDAGVIGQAKRLAIEVDFPNSGDEWRGSRVPVQGRMGDGRVEITEAYAIVGETRTPLEVARDGSFNASVPLPKVGRNIVTLTASARDGTRNDVALKLRRVPGMSFDEAIPVESRPTIALSAPRSQASADSIELKGTARAPGRIAKVEYFLNGQYLADDSPSDAEAREFRFSKKVPLRPGSNLITVTVVDRSDRVAHSVLNLQGRATAPVSDSTPSAGASPYEPRPNAARAPRRGPLGPIGRKIALVIGVSEYRNADQISQLRYAHTDAELVATLLEGQGDFDEVRLLTNAEATSNAIRREIFEFLGKAIAEDLVVIYFAGHGAPDPRNLGNLYLVTHDTDVDSMSSTAFPMWEMETAIQEKIHSERVVLIADACHSGGIGSRILTRGIKVVSNPAHEYLAAMSGASGRMALTASEASELSQEGPQWGGGHGVFTWSLVEGLRGAADLDGNRIVSLGEAVDYASEQVRRETRNQQHPDVAGRFDRKLPLIVLPN